MTDTQSGIFHLWVGSQQEILDSIAGNITNMTILSVAPQLILGDVMYAVVKFNT